MATRLTDAGNRAWRALALTSHLLTAELERQTQRDAGMPHIYYVLLVALYEARVAACARAPLPMPGESAPAD